MKTLTITAVAAAALGLSACASSPGSPTATLLESDTMYGKAAAAALEYESLPRCEHAVTGACSVPSAVEDIREADNEAQDALRLAKAAVSDGNVSDGDAAVIRSARAEVQDYLNLLSELGIAVE